MFCRRTKKFAVSSLGCFIILVICAMMYIRGYRTLPVQAMAYIYPGTSSGLNKSRGSAESYIDQSDAELSVSEHSNPAQGPADVLILAYMRSGSSFMGKVLGNRHDTFYWYEPLHHTHVHTFIAGNGSVCNEGKYGCREVSDASIESLHQSKQFLVDLYNCQHLDRHVTERFKSIAALMSNAGPERQAFKKCHTSWEHPCYKLVDKECHRASHRVTKVLRLATLHAGYFLDELPRLKLVQILRDPRGVINSARQTWKGRSKLTVEQEAEILCNRMEADLESALTLKSLYPRRVQIVQYEDFSDPLRLGNHLYRFVNMDMTDYERNKLMSLAQGDEFNPNTYRTQIDWEVNVAVNNQCRELLHKLGYRVFKRLEDLRNTNVSSVRGELPFRIGSLM